MKRLRRKAGMGGRGPSREIVSLRDHEATKLKESLKENDLVYFGYGG